MKEDVPDDTVVLGNPSKPFRKRIVSENVDSSDLTMLLEKPVSFRKKIADSTKVNLLRLICR